MVEYRAAMAMSEVDPDAAFDGLTRSFEMAVVEQNADCAALAGVKACFLLHQKELTVETGKLAHRVLVALDDLPAANDADHLRRKAQLFGFLECGLLMEGKTGLAWKANHAVAESLRGKSVRSDADGPAIRVADILAMDQESAGLGWRAIEREADLLDTTGRSNEARCLLDEAAEYLLPRWPGLPSFDRFYAFKLLAARAMIMDFLGFDEEAIRQQRVLEEAGEGMTSLSSSYLILRFNLLRNLSQWEGPTEERLEMARGISRQLASLGTTNRVDRTLAKMELDLRESKDAMEALRTDVDRNARLGHVYELAYADRDLLTARAKQGDNGLDAEFVRLLDVMRSQGRKTSEPTLYREYGVYLLDRNHPAEAVPMLAEALRLTRTFGWSLHEPNLLRLLFDARFAAGDLEGARATIAELDAWIEAHPDAPSYQRMLAEYSRALAHARLGETPAAKSGLAKTRKIADALPAYWKSQIPEKFGLEIGAQSGTKERPPASGSISPLRVQPLEVVTMASPGDPARTRFSVFNPTGGRVRGQWRIQGPGAQITGDLVSFAAGRPTTTVILPGSIGPGEPSWLVASMKPAPGTGQASVSVAWENDARETGPAGTWSITWDRAATGGVVLDASSLESSPFRFVPLFHELAVPPGEDLGIPFRLRCAQALRFEYYDARSQQLLAIDANGNGCFEDVGDLAMTSSSGTAAAMIPVKSTDRAVTVEVHVFAPNGQSPAPGSGILKLDAEILRGGDWVKEAEDILK